MSDVRANAAHLIYHAFATQISRWSTLFSAGVAFMLMLGFEAGKEWVVAPLIITRWHSDWMTIVFVTVVTAALHARSSRHSQGVQMELATSKKLVDDQLHRGRAILEMTELLQTARTRDEVRLILGAHLERLLADLGGTVFLFSPSRDVLEPAVSWGGGDVTAAEFAVDECWALRLGKPYGTGETANQTRCLHVPIPVSDSHGFGCVPMMADGETLGILHVHQLASTKAGEPLSAEQWPRVLQTAERLTLPLANLRLRETLRDQSIRDELTGVFNRRYMKESLLRELRRAARHGTAVSLVLLDLDHFKKLNDAFGHDVGDEALRALGRLLRTRVRGEDIVCRYGGEEFALVLPETTAAMAIARTEQLRLAAGALEVDNRAGGEALVQFSAGVATFPEDGTTPEALLASADRGLYQAKAGGRDRVVSTRPVAKGAIPVASSGTPVQLTLG